MQPLLHWPALTSGGETANSEGAAIEVSRVRMTADQQLDAEIDRANQKERRRHSSADWKPTMRVNDGRRRSSTPPHRNSSTAAVPSSHQEQRSPRTSSAARFGGKRHTSSGGSRTSSIRSSNGGRGRTTAMERELAEARSQAMKAEEMVQKLENYMEGQQEGVVTRIQQLERQRDTYANQVQHVHHRREQRLQEFIGRTQAMEDEARRRVEESDAASAKMRQYALQQEDRVRQLYEMHHEEMTASQMVAANMSQEVQAYVMSLQSSGQGALDHSRKQVLRVTEHLSRASMENAELRQAMVALEQQAAHADGVESRIAHLEKTL